MRTRGKRCLRAALVLVAGVGLAVGCGGDPFFASQFQITTTSGGGTPGGGGTEPGGGGGTTGVNRFVTVHIRNTTLERIHYYLHFIAFAGPGATVADEDEIDYLDFGYIDTGAASFTFGSITVTAPAADQRVLWYFHEMGNFPASSVGPATGIGGAIPTYDPFFDVVGALVPVPDIIIFYNGAPAGDPCLLRSFRRTDNTGFFTLQWFSPQQIQDTACNCLAAADPTQVLAPLTVAPTAALCNEFLRGSDILYEFRGADPAGRAERLLWQVTLTGTTVHDFVW